ncbi:MAG: AgmX/PglI C-terminal domain-containing protein [Deltaproteobacteria bacterium]|nr:AgmX/PglI C-terminal domain-containing protein [Deltaproteobacteria bacterium]
MLSRYLGVVVPIVCATAAHAQTPPRLGLSGAAKGLSMTDPKTVKFEADLLAAINELRKAAKLEALPMDDRLRVMARRQAEGVAKGERSPTAIEDELKAQRLAPNGSRVQYVAGVKPKDILKEVERDKTATASLKEEFARIGVGAFFVPEDKAPYFQVTIVVAKELDPMAGKPGLTLDATNKVMADAANTIKSLCYDPALRINPNFSGNLVFQLVIGDKGQVDSAKLNVKTNNDGFDGCALGVARGLQFPPPYKGRPVTLNHPLRFLPPHGDKKVGRLADGHVSRVFRMAEGAIKACYDERVKANPSLKGAIALYLLVGPDGAVKNLVVEHDEPGDPALTVCVSTEVHKLVFPAPEFGADAEVRFPVRFEPPPKPKP